MTSSLTSLDDCRERILDELAAVRGITRDDLIEQITDPDHRIDSQEAEFVIATLEGKLGVQIPQVEELPATAPLNLDVLVNHVYSGCTSPDSSGGS